MVIRFFRSETRVTVAMIRGTACLSIFKKYEFPENKVKATAVFRVEIESMTGKQFGF